MSTLCCRSGTADDQELLMMTHQRCSDDVAELTYVAKPVMYDLEVVVWQI